MSSPLKVSLSINIRMIRNLFALRESQLWVFSPVEADAQVVHGIAVQRSRRALDQVSANCWCGFSCFDHGLDKGGAHDATATPNCIFGLFGFDHSLKKNDAQHTNTCIAFMTESSEYPTWMSWKSGPSKSLTINATFPKFCTDAALASGILWSGRPNRSCWLPSWIWRHLAVSSPTIQMPVISCLTDVSQVVHTDKFM